MYSNRRWFRTCPPRQLPHRHLAQTWSRVALLCTSLATVVSGHLSALNFGRRLPARKKELLLRTAARVFGWSVDAVPYQLARSAHWIDYCETGSIAWLRLVTQKVAEVKFSVITMFWVRLSSPVYVQGIWSKTISSSCSIMTSQVSRETV